MNKITSLLERFWILIAVLFMLASLLVLLPPVRSGIRITVSTVLAHLSKSVSEPYPTIITDTLDPVQQRIVELTAKEYKLRPVSFDERVLVYSEGLSEPWCADFVSWVMKQAGVPYKNPNSGHWRIPGVLTLQEYYQTQGKYRKVGTYTPKTGDIAIYIGEKTLDGRSRQHTNIILKIEGETMTTIGGNEQGRTRISTQSYKSKQNSLVGFGVL